MVVDFQGIYIIYIFTYESIMSMTTTSLYAHECVPRMLNVYFWKLRSTEQKSGICAFLNEDMSTTLIFQL